MAAKEFLSARIPKELLKRLESHANAAGESKSSILIEALTEYLNPGKAHDEEGQDLQRWIYDFRNFQRSVLGQLNEIDDLRYKFFSELQAMNDRINILEKIMQPHASLPKEKSVLKQASHQRRLMPANSQINNIPEEVGDGSFLV